MGRKLAKTGRIGTGNLLTWIFLVASAVAQPQPSDGKSGTDNDDPQPGTNPGYQTNLWLSINLSNNTVQLLLHNTQPGVPYLIRSRQDLISGSWLSETTVTGAVAATTTPAVLNMVGRTNCLFIQALTEMTNITAGATAMLAIGGVRIMELTTNGNVICWGGNKFGELGDYTHLDSTNPVHAVGLANITKIAAGLNYSLAIDAEGALWTWGQLDEGPGAINFPVKVSGMTNVIAMAAYGREGAPDPAVAVKADGTVWMWGMSDCDDYGFPPVQIAGLSNVVSVAAGDCQTLALTTNGMVWMWGSGNDIPVPVSGLSNIVAICAGDSHALALASSGVVWAWGDNSAGQLGDGETERYSAAPVRVVGLTNVIGIAGGTWHSVAVDGQGRLWAWGNDQGGQLGDGGSVGHASLPMQVHGLSNIVSAAAGSFASAALDGNGRGWQWGMGSDWPRLKSWSGEDGHPALSPTCVDFYNGQLPNVQALSGNHQMPHAGFEFPQPLIFKVTDANGVALSNAPVSAEVVAGDMKLRTARGGDDYNGLRLTTDANGEVTLVGYADRYAIDTNCQVRVLAASRERLAEVDFIETLVQPPTVGFVSPADGANVLVGPGRSLTLAVNAVAAPGASIREVDYSYHTNGGAETLLGLSTQSPYSFTWTDAAWWTNAFVGQYSISAVAVDDGGAPSDPQSVNITVALDSDGNGLPDYWQMRFFSHLGVDPGADPDGDGINNLQEYQEGTGPTDFYNGRLPYLEILSGNDQTGNYNSFLPEPVSIKVSGSRFFDTFIPNAPVTFTVTNGTALLAATTNDTPVSSLVLRSDANGRVSTWVYFPPSRSNPPDSTILASVSSEAGSVATTINEFIPLAHWRFDDTNTWVGEQGQLPVLADNVAGLPGWSSNAVSVSGVNAAVLSYNVVESNGHTNINYQTGSVLFWFKPDWSSAGAGGSGPGYWGRLIESGSDNPANSPGWWSLYLNPDGTQLVFTTAGNGQVMTNLSAAISWYSNEWHQIALTYSPAGSALYVDGQQLANGTGVTCFPNAGALADGFRIGCDQSTNNPAGGAFDELETFDYPLSAANAVSCRSQIPDWWEIKYFGQAGLSPDFQPDNDGSSLEIDYQLGRYPNVINFSLATTNACVTDGLVPVRIQLQGGIPFGMAVAVNTTNFVVVPNQLFDISASFTAVPWQPCASNLLVPLNSGDGDYYVWVGLRGLSHDAQQTWRGARLTLDTTPPGLTITNPAANAVSQPVIQLQGCANESLSSLTYDISNVSGICTNLTGYVTGQFCDTNLLAITTNYFQCYNLVLTSNGVNLITLHATDLAGNTTTRDFGFTVDASTDTNPPVLTVLWPQDGTRVSGTNFTLQAHVNDPMTAVVASVVDANGRTNIIQCLVEQGGLVWARNLPLASGENRLTVTATDAAGNTSVTKLTLFQSSAIVTMNPLGSDQLNQPSVNVSGTLSDPSYTVTVNGVIATVNSDGTWEADGVPASSSGTAIVDVELYSGKVPDLARPRLRFSPADAPSGVNEGSQLFAVPQPVKVGLMSYLAGTSSCGMIAGGRYCAVDPCCGPAFANEGDRINWTYQAGGFDGGYYYCSGYFNSGPGAPGWWMLCSPEDSVWGNPLLAGEDAFSAPWENNSDAQRFVQTHVMIEPQGQDAAGATATYLVQAQAWDAEGAGQLPSDSLRIRGVTLTPSTNNDGSIWGQTLFSAPAGINVDVTPMAPGNYDYNVQATELDLKLAVDNNRDGQIAFDDTDATTPTKPFRFWINDSQEHGDDETSGGAEDQIPGVPLIEPDPEDDQGPTPNYGLNHVNGRSDLVNFFPVALCLSNALQLLPTSSGYEYHLYQADSTTIGEAVNFAYTSLKPDNTFSYLTDANSLGYGTNLDEPAMNADTIPVNHDVTLDTNWLTYVQNNGGTGIILVEGCAATPHPLMLEIWRNGRMLTGVPLYLSVSGVEQMFRHVNFSYVNGTVEVPARADARNEPPTNDKSFVFLHGYNVNQQEARGVLSEMFKRMYWSGSKAKFYGVTWNGAESKNTVPFGNLFTPNYHTNVVNALQTAPHLADFLSTLPADKTVVAAHSLGNMVVLSAISDYNTAPSKYFMLDAAVPMEAVQGDISYNPNMIYSAWNQYANRTFASDWWLLFNNGDARGTLTWSNRLGNLGNVDIYNFYSSGEEVLREYDSDPPSTVLGGIVTEVWDGEPFGLYAWVWQEKGKGTCRQDWFLGSSHGGWRFPVNEYGDPNPVPPSMANSLPDATLQQTPIFDFGSYFDGVDGPFPDLALLDANGSTYAQANRDRILSDSIPALTLPVGANSVIVLDERGAGKRNFNMQADFENGWPEKRFTSEEQNSNWYHSDFDYVAYAFTHELFDEIVNAGNLK